MEVAAMTLNKTMLVVWLSLTLGNVLYQGLGGHNWKAAFERSYFQGTAFVALALVLKLR